MNGQQFHNALRIMLNLDADDATSRPLARANFTRQDTASSG